MSNVYEHFKGIGPVVVQDAAPNPRKGTAWLDTSTEKLKIWDGTQWVNATGSTAYATRHVLVNNWYSRGGTMSVTQFPTNSNTTAQIYSLRLTRNTGGTNTRVYFYPNQLPEWVDVSEDIGVWLPVGVNNGATDPGDTVYIDVHIDHFDPANTSTGITETALTPVVVDMYDPALANMGTDYKLIGTIPGGTLAAEAVYGIGWGGDIRDDSGNWTMVEQLNTAVCLTLKCVPL